MTRKHVIIPIFVPHNGCPFDCVFCNQNKISNTYKELTAEDVNNEVKKYLDEIDNIDNRHIEIAFFGGSFTGIKKEKQNELLSAANRWYLQGVIKDIRLSTRPDYISEDILTNLKNHNVSIIELGVQSMSDDVLVKSNRGHSSKQVEKACDLIKKYDFKLGLQMMIGLPGDTFEKDMYTAKKIISYNPDFIRIYPTLVIKDTYLENMYSCGTYDPLTLEKAIEITKHLYLTFNHKGIKIIRIGLQPTDNISLGKDVVAGPFHPSFRQLVESEIYKEEIYKTLKKVDKTFDSIAFEVNPKDISKLVGNKRSNFTYIKNKFHIKHINIIENIHLEKNTLFLIIKEQKIKITPIF